MWSYKVHLTFRIATTHPRTHTCRKRCAKSCGISHRLSSLRKCRQAIAPSITKPQRKALAIFVFNDAFSSVSLTTIFDGIVYYLSGRVLRHDTPLYGKETAGDSGRD